MKISSSDFCEWSIQKAADLLLNQLDETGEDHAGCECYGITDDDKMYCLKNITIKEVKKNVNE